MGGFFGVASKEDCGDWSAYRQRQNLPRRSSALLCGNHPSVSIAHQRQEWGAW